NLPPEKLFTESVRLLDCNTHDRLTCFLQGFHGRILSAIGRGLQTEIRKYPVAPVALRLCQSLAVHRNNSLSDLPRGFSEELLKPGPKIGNARRRNDCHLVPSVVRQRSEDRSQRDPGILRCR